ncbi:MAG TPA: hypothetical protein EYG03_23620 [Planctomycetes bacterium]|nr:hypothetical protein [Planctomycetota bacterium]
MKFRNSIAITIGVVLVLLAAGNWQTFAQKSEGIEPSGTELFTHPRIKDHGKIVRLPDAAEQPRDGSKICVDVTAGGSSDAINPAIEKVARFVNIYAGAGRRPADVQITVILHGKATLAALNNESYANQLRADRNPNVPLFEKLKEAGVEILVCGQSLAHKGGRHEDVASEVRIAVSALTVNVNRQLDGYVFIPLH